MLLSISLSSNIIELYLKTQYLLHQFTANSIKHDAQYTISTILKNVYQYEYYSIICLPRIIRYKKKNFNTLLANIYMSLYCTVVPHPNDILSINSIKRVTVPISRQYLTINSIK